MTTFTVNLRPAIDLTDEQFWQICVANQDLRFEKSAAGELVIMPPTGGGTSRSNAKCSYQLVQWTETIGDGESFDSSGGFQLPNGATRSPDAAWVKQERWDGLSIEAQERFVPLCPDFVIEILSPSDSLKATQAKMQEYLDNGAQLGFLINRKSRQVEIYRPERSVEVLDNPQTVSGEPLLAGFTLNLAPIW
jgi:Uma2 family endonuclease